MAHVSAVRPAEVCQPLAVRMAELTTWIAIAAAVVAVMAAVLTGWQLWVAHRHSRYSAEQARRAEEQASAAKHEAEQAVSSATRAHDQARWAWEQVKLASTQLDEARWEHRASAQVEQWEWAYALTMTARDLVDSSHELVRVTLDAQVAPHYRRATDRQYRQNAERWQDTMVKASARISPSLEVQHQVVTFAQVHQRLHGRIDVLLRAAETDTLTTDDPMPRQVLGLRQELANVHRQLQRTISATLANPNDDEQTETKQITTSHTSNGYAEHDKSRTQSASQPARRVRKLEG